MGSTNSHQIGRPLNSEQSEFVANLFSNQKNSAEAAADLDGVGNCTLGKSTLITDESFHKMEQSINNGNGNCTLGNFRPITHEVSIRWVNVLN